MPQYILASITWTLLVVLPGYVLLAALVPQLREDRILAASAAPAVSLAMWFVISQTLSIIHVPLWPLMPLLGVVAVLALLAAAARRRATEGTPVAGRVERSDSAGTLPVLVLALSICVGVAIWAVGVRGQPDPPPSRDAEYHAVFVKRIIDSGSLDPGEVLVSDPVTEQPIGEFYPLAMHGVIAMQSKLTSLDIGLLLTSWTVLFGAVVLPAGLYALVRRLLPRDELAAGFAALVIPFSALLPYHPAGWGGVPTVVGFAMVPAALALIGLSGDQPLPRWCWRAAAATACVGLAATHTSQAAFLAVITLITEAAQWWRGERSWSAARARSLNLLMIAAIAALLYLPDLIRLSSAVAEREDVLDEPFTTTADALGRLLTFSYPNTDLPQPALVALVLAGLWLSIRNRVLGGWALCLGVTVALFMSTMTADAPWHLLRPLTVPWYSSTWRTVYNVAFVAVVFAGYALYEVARGLQWVLAGRLPRERLVAAAVTTFAFLLAAAATTVGQPIGVVRDTWSASSRPTADMLAAFDYLRANTAPGEAILNDDLDGSPWMYPSAGLHPLLAIEDGGTTEHTKDERAYLIANIGSYDVDPRVRALVEKYGVRYVLVVDRSWLGYQQRTNRQSLLDSDALREVYSAGTAHVFVIQR